MDSPAPLPYPGDLPVLIRGESAGAEHLINKGLTVMMTDRHEKRTKISAQPIHYIRSGPNDKIHTKPLVERVFY